MSTRSYVSINSVTSQGLDRTMSKPSAAGLSEHLKILYEYRDLLKMWTIREIKVRYRQSFLGAAWAILQPLGLMLVFTAVFSYLTRVPTGDVPYPLFCYAALLPWTFLATSISFAAPSMVSNLNLVTKIYFPREILPMAIVIAAFVDFLVASFVFAGMLAFYRVAPTVNLLWLPALLAIQTALTLGAVLFLSALGVRYRDIRFVVPLGLQIWMFASPVIYPASLIPSRYQALYSLNPTVGLMNAYRSVVIHGNAPEATSLITSSAISVTLMLAGYVYFKRCESSFADII